MSSKFLRVNGLGRVARTGQRSGAYKVLVVKPEPNRPLGIPGRKLEDCRKVDLQEIWLGVGGGAPTGFIWLTTGTCGGLLRTGK